MIHLKKLTLTLVALFAMTTGAWADEGTLLVTITPDGSGNPTYSVDGIATLDKGAAVYNTSKACWTKGDQTSLTVTVAEGINVTKVKFNCYGGNSWEDKDAPYQVFLFNFSAYSNAELLGYIADYGVTSIEVYGYKKAPAGTALTPDDTRKVWTLDKMPAGNVELQVAYFPGMLTLPAKTAQGSIEVVSSAGAKALDVPASWENDQTQMSAADLPDDFAAIDDADLPTTIAAMASDPHASLIYGFDGEKTKIASYLNGAKNTTESDNYNRLEVYCLPLLGYKVYYTTATLPDGFEQDEQGNLYVEPKTQFQVKAVPAEGYRLVSLSDGTNTYDVDADGIATVTMPEGDADLTLTATFSDEYELAFEALNANTIEDGKATVKVGDEDKTATLKEDGKLSVKAGQTVTLTAKQGYKFRSVESKKPGSGKTFVAGETTLNLESFIVVDNNKDGTITLHMPTLNPSTYFINGYERTLHFGYEKGSGTDLSFIGDKVGLGSWSGHTAFSELDKTIDITSGEPRVAILVLGHVSTITCPAPEFEFFWGLYRYTNPVKVTYNLNGGNVGGSTDNKVEYLFSGDNLATTFAAPIRDGFDFAGWYTASDGGSLLTTSTATSATTIYAHWNAK